MRPYPKEGREKTGRTDTSQVHPRRQATAIESVKRSIFLFFISAMETATWSQSVIDGPTLLHDELRSHGWFVHDRQISYRNATTTTATDDGPTWVIGWLVRLISGLPWRYPIARPSRYRRHKTAGGGSGKLRSHLFEVKKEHETSVFQNLQHRIWPGGSWRKANHL